MHPRQALSAMACLLLGACATPLQNVTLVSVAAFDGRNAAEAARAFNRPYLKIEFATDRDLRSYAARYAMVLTAHADFCPSLSAAPSLLQYSPDIYDAKGVVDAYLDSFTEAPRRNYSFYVSLASVLTEGQRYYPYDLRQKPADVCFRLDADSALTYRMSSNIVMIPAARIAAALSAR